MSIPNCRPTGDMKTILVHMMHDDGRHRRLATAISLAMAHQSHLIGVFTKSPHLTPAPIVGRGASSAFLREMEAGLREQEQDVKAEFDAATSKAGLSAEWRHHDGEIVEGLAYHSHVADLLIVSQTPRETVEDIVTGNRADHVMLVAGCGTLIVPHREGPAETGNRVLVAWTRTHEAARAVRDALPILRVASSVTILTCRASRERPGQAIKAHLQRHGVKADVRNDYGANDEIGEVVLAHAEELSADLIVMGAYGHSRLREVVLGGTTSHILSHATVPVLMSH
jgi:nucleotide-binding universal stress UspA family protein